MIDWEDNCTKQILFVIILLVILGLLGPYVGLYLFFDNPQQTEAPVRTRKEVIMESTSHRLLNRSERITIEPEIRPLGGSHQDKPKPEKPVDSLLQIEDLLNK